MTRDQFRNWPRFGEGISIAGRRPRKVQRASLRPTSNVGAFSVSSFSSIDYCRLRPTSATTAPDGPGLRCCKSWRIPIAIGPGFTDGCAAHRCFPPPLSPARPSLASGWRLPFPIPSTRRRCRWSAWCSTARTQVCGGCHEFQDHDQARNTLAPAGLALRQCRARHLCLGAMVPPGLDAGRRGHAAANDRARRGKIAEG